MYETYVSEGPLSMLPLVTRKMALVVEDELPIATFLASLLEGLNFYAVIASTVNRALQLIRERKFEIAFVDLGLPDRSGLEVIAELKSLFEELPIVIASGYAQMAFRDMAESSLKLNILSKPYDEIELIKTLRNMGFHLP